MRMITRTLSVRLAPILALMILAGSLLACSVSVAISWDDDDDRMADVAPANSHLATRVAANEALISYLSTIMPRDPRLGRPPIDTPTPHLPVQGAVIIEQGRCCAGGIAGDTIRVSVAFRASSPTVEVTEMRVRVGSRAYEEREMAEADWEPFVRQKRYPIRVALNWMGFFVSVQYRDAQGNMSPVFFDDISVEGMPPTPTVSSD